MKNIFSKKVPQINIDAVIGSVFDADYELEQPSDRATRRAMAREQKKNKSKRK